MARWLSQPHPSARAALAESGTVCLSGKGEMPRRPATKARAAAHVRITISYLKKHQKPLRPSVFFCRLRSRRNFGLTLGSALQGALSGPNSPPLTISSPIVARDDVPFRHIMTWIYPVR